MNDSPYNWRYSLITNSADNTTTMIRSLDGSGNGNTVDNFDVQMLPFMLAGQRGIDNVKLNVCNIFEDDVFNADKRNTDADTKESAEHVRIW